MAQPSSPTAQEVQTPDGVAFVFSRTFPGRTAAQVRQVIWQWLMDNHVRDVREDYLGVIRGVHGSIWHLGWHLKAEKKIELMVILQLEALSMRITVSPMVLTWLDVELMNKEAMFNWETLANDVFQRIERNESSPSHPIRTGPRKVTEDQRRLHRQVRLGGYSILVGAVMAIVGFATMGMLPSSFIGVFSLLIGATIALLGVLALVGAAYQGQF